VKTFADIESFEGSFHFSLSALSFFLFCGKMFCCSCNVICVVVYARALPSGVVKQ